MKLRYHFSALVIIACLPLSVSAERPKDLTAKTYNSGKSVLILQVNWGRAWSCGGFENAQLQALRFTRMVNGNLTDATLSLSTPSRLLAKNTFTPYALVVEPGEYAMSAYDVKVARSQSDVGHLTASPAELVQERKPIAGTFTVNPGEIVYIGHFGLDCHSEPIPWRYYIDGRDEFSEYVDGFRKKYRFASNIPVQYRLFSTDLFGVSDDIVDFSID